IRAAQHRRAVRRGERGNDPDGTVRRAQGIRGRRRRDRGDPEGRRRAAVAPRRASAPGGVGREGVKGKPVRAPTRPLPAAAPAPLLPPPVFPSPARPAVVSDIRAWTNQEYTRVVIDLAADAKYEANFLRADPARNLPPRIFIDIHGADLPADIVRPPAEVNNGLLTRVRAGQYRAGVVRVVIDLERESGYRVFDLSDPSRIIVDVDGAAETGVRPVVPGRGGKIVVMLDPGHGGKGPGGAGPAGPAEE